MTAVAEWLDRKYLEWQLSLGGRRTIAQFAEYLDVAQPSLSEWMSGKYYPRGASVGKIAEKLGYDIYDTLGIPRPLPKDLSPTMMEMVQALEKLPEEFQMMLTTALKEIAPVVTSQDITDENQIARMLVEALKK